MNRPHTLQLQDLDRAAFRRVADVVRFGRPGGVDAEIDDREQRISMRTRDPEAIAYVEALVADTRKAQRKIGCKVLYEHKARWMTGEDVDPALAASTDLYQMGEGLIGLRGRVLELFRFFERTFVRLARRYRAEENHYPVLLPARILEEVRYFSHFPQHVTFCGHLPEDLPLLERFACEVEEGEGRLPSDLTGRLTTLSHALKPAVCLPCYGQRRGSIVEGDDGDAVTMQNHVFRYEGSTVRSLARLWEFSVRDLVFFGRREIVEELRREVMRWSIALCGRLDLEARIQQAHDPFFLDQSRDKIVYQHMGDVKYELVLEVPAREEELAVASFNLHRDFYSSVYNIRSKGGELAETACMGFGLERWVYGLLAQKGLDPRRWPRALGAAAKPRH